jgi:hypothetical protein
MTSTATATHLQYVIDNWQHLTDMLTTRHGSTWPTVMGIEHVLDGSDEAAEERATLRLAERADSRYTLGASPAPIRLHIVDVIRSVDTDLVYLADVLAQEVQRPVMRRAPSHWAPADRELRDQLVAEDEADPRRWRYRQHRTAPFAAAWLVGQVERALDGVRQAQVVDRPCPLCGGTLGMSSGDGGTPIVACFGCRQEWTAAA